MAQNDASKEPANAAMKLCMEQRLKPEELVSIAHGAGERILQVYYAAANEWDVQTKADESPLTEADKQANSYICEQLSQLAPHVPIVSEENAAVPYTTRQHYQYSFCVDPLDGTKEFIKRNGQFTVNIALLRGNQPVMGVVHTPVFEQTHWGASGYGAFKRDGKSAADMPIECASFESSADGLTLVGSATHNNSATQDFVNHFRNPSFTQLGSSLKLMLVAEGKAHIYPRLAPTSEWDTAAAHAIVEQAGGCVLQAGDCDDSGNPIAGVDWQRELAKEQSLVYNKRSSKNPMFVVYGKVSGPKLPSSSYCSQM